ncbi:hypothetical protein OSTOST_01618 [Ostertagia ostertagi]
MSDGTSSDCGYGANRISEFQISSNTADSGVVTEIVNKLEHPARGKPQVVVPPPSGVTPGPPQKPQTAAPPEQGTTKAADQAPQTNVPAATQGPSLQTYFGPDVSVYEVTMHPPGPGEQATPESGSLPPDGRVPPGSGLSPGTGSPDEEAAGYGNGKLIIMSDGTSSDCGYGANRISEFQISSNTADSGVVTEIVNKLEHPARGKPQVVVPPPSGVTPGPPQKPQTAAPPEQGTTKAADQAPQTNAPAATQGPSLQTYFGPDVSVYEVTMHPPGPGEQATPESGSLPPDGRVPPGSGLSPGTGSPDEETSKT